MAWTQADVDALKAALKSKYRVVEFTDRRVEYRSVREVAKALSIVEADVNASTRTKVVKAYIGEDL